MARKLKEEINLRDRICVLAARARVDRTTASIITDLIRAVREDAIKCYHDWESRPKKFHPLAFPEALRNNMRWRSAIRKAGRR